MKLTLLKILYFCSIAITIFFICTTIYNPSGEYGSVRTVNNYFIFAIIGSIVFPFIIFYITNKNKWFAFSFITILLAVFCLINFKSDFLQRTIFVNQISSSYKVQKGAITYINDHHKKVVQLAQVIENKLKVEDFENDTEVTIINSRLEMDEISTANYKGKIVKRRLICTDISKYGLSADKEFIYRFTIKNYKVQNIEINTQSKDFSATFYPYGFNQYDKDVYSPNHDVVQSESSYYRDQFVNRTYIYKNSWVFTIVRSDGNG